MLRPFVLSKPRLRRDGVRAANEFIVPGDDQPTPVFRHSRVKCIARAQEGLCTLHQSNREQRPAMAASMISRERNSPSAKRRPWRASRKRRANAQATSERAMAGSTIGVRAA